MFICQETRFRILDEILDKKPDSFKGSVEALLITKASAPALRVEIFCRNFLNYLYQGTNVHRKLQVLYEPTRGESDSICLQVFSDSFSTICRRQIS